MTKIERFEAVERCLYWEERKILVVGDLHLGYERYLNERGWSFPRTQIEETIGVFKKIFEEIGKVKEIIILGDVKHYFEGFLSAEYTDVYSVFDFLEENLLVGGKIVITKGNHDGILENAIGKYKNIELKESYCVDDVLFFHGHKQSWQSLKEEIKDKKIKLLVVGHFHPAISISDGAKIEKYKSFLFGKIGLPALFNTKEKLAKHYDKEHKKNLIIMPSFFVLVEGTEVHERFEGMDVGNFEAYVVAEKVYGFGKISKLK